MLFSVPLFGAIQLIQLKDDSAVNRYPGNQNQTNLNQISDTLFRESTLAHIAAKVQKKNFILDQVYSLPNGPGTGFSSPPEWKALLSAMVTSDAGHTQ